MKHVPNGREERRTASDGTPRTRSQLQASGKVCVPIGSGSIVRAMEKDAYENPMRVVRVEKLVLNVRAGASGDRLVRAEKALQQAERRIQSHRKSRKSGRREEKSPDDDEVISTLQKAIEVFRKRTI